MHLPSKCQRPRHRYRVTTGEAVRAAVLWLMAGAASGWSAGDVDITTLSLEELMDTRVTLVSRTEQALFEAPAAVAVITREELQRAGVTTLPAALNLVPGMQVARIDASKWTVTARSTGFRFDNELLVLIDGRSVYSPLFSGIYWEIQDLLLEDVERIEVIRGPGATLWGANAFSGIVNVVTREAARTQGMLATAGAGTEERLTAGVRYGGAVGEAGHYRLYFKQFARGPAVDASGNEAHDDWGGRRAGLRADWKLQAGNSLMLQGDVYGVEQANEFTFFELSPPFVRARVDTARISGGFLLGRWERRFSPVADLRFQVYFDRTRHREAYLEQRQHVFDIDFQHRFVWRSQHELIWGAEGRWVDDELEDSFLISLTPDSRRVAHYSAFVQDDIALARARMHLILGTKWERNPFSGWEVQPNLRLLWMPRPRWTLWAAVSRAVRTPSRSEVDGQLVVEAIWPPSPAAGEPPVFVVGQGTRQQASEKLTALEAGCRLRPAEHLYLDLTGYVHLRRDILDVEIGAPVRRTDPPPAHTVIPFVLKNGLASENYGIEALAAWEAGTDRGLQLAYTFLELRNRAAPSTLSVNDSPRHRLVARGWKRLPGGWRLDGTARYVGPLSRQGVESFWELDLRLGWAFGDGAELALVGQNLLHDRHPETVVKIIDYPPRQVRRGLYARVTWGF